MLTNKRQNLLGWVFILGFFGFFFLIGWHRFHMVQPGWYIVFSLLSSALLVVAIWLIHCDRPATDDPEEKQ